MHMSGACCSSPSQFVHNLSVPKHRYRRKIAAFSSRKEKSPENRRKKSQKNRSAFGARKRMAAFPRFLNHIFKMLSPQHIWG